MTETLIGYARCSTDRQDLTARRQALAELGVALERIYMDKGLTGTSRARPGLDQAMAAARKGDTLWCPSWTAWPDRCPMPGTSPTNCRKGG